MDYMHISGTEPSSVILSETCRLNIGSILRNACCASGDIFIWCLKLMRPFFKISFCMHLLPRMNVMLDFI